MNALRSRPLVLMYHAVGERGAQEDPFCLFVPQDRLYEQLASLLARGWTPLALDTYLHGVLPPRSLLVTFDDGYQAMLDEGLPVLRELKMPATVFVLGGLLGGRSRWMPEMPDEPLLDAEGVRELAGAGLDVECHGWEHSTLLKASPEALARNTTQAAQALTDLTGRRPRAFAYPYGDHDARARRAVAEAGFEIGFSTYHAEGRYATPRVAVSPTDTSATFRLKVLPAYPVMRRISGHVPKLRPALHSLIGRAPRS